MGSRKPADPLNQLFLLLNGFLRPIEHISVSAAEFQRKFFLLDLVNSVALFSSFYSSVRLKGEFLCVSYFFVRVSFLMSASSLYEPRSPVQCP